jgi:ferredoxin-NADP reductase
MSTTVTWPVFQAALMRREIVAERTMSFRFAKPADWSYRAGQFVDITLPDPPRPMPRGTRAASPSRAHHVRA